MMIDGFRIGPRMADVVEYVASHPGCPKIEPARYVAPHPEKGLRQCGLQYGYETVNRCLSAGLITGDLVGRGYQLELTGKGHELMRSGK